MENQVRLSNIELCRIFAIICVLLVHSDFAALGSPGNLDETSLGLIATECFSIIGVNVFVLITGYFSVFPKKKSLFNLSYCCFYYGMMKIGFDIFMGNQLSIKSFLFITNSNWFITAYIGLLLFAPLINAFCEKATRKQLLGGVILIIIYELYMGFFPGFNARYTGFNGGYSCLSFIVLYLIGRFIRLYGMPDWMKRWSIWLYIACSLLLTFVMYAVLHANQEKMTNHAMGLLLAYNNPLTILSSVCFFLTFEKMNFRNNLVNYLAKSVLGVLLVQCSSQYSFYWIKNFNYINRSFEGITLMNLWIVSILATFLFAVILDQGRIYSYDKIVKFLKL